MTKGKINKRVILDRVSYLNEMLNILFDFKKMKKEEFINDVHMVASFESHLRRGLECLFDLGRHILAKEFAYPASEYKEIAIKLLEKDVLSESDATKLKKMAGYRNRMVHFYNEVTKEELYEIAKNDIDDIPIILESLKELLKKKK